MPLLMMPQRLGRRSRRVGNEFRLLMHARFRLDESLRTSSLFSLEPLEPRLLMSSDILPEVGAAAAIVETLAPDRPVSVIWDDGNTSAENKQTPAELSSLVVPLLAEASDRLASLGFSTED